MFNLTSHETDKWHILSPIYYPNYNKEVDLKLLSWKACLSFDSTHGRQIPTLNPTHTTQLCPHHHDASWLKDGSGWHSTTWSQLQAWERTGCAGRGLLPERLLGDTRTGEMEGVRDEE